MQTSNLKDLLARLKDGSPILGTSASSDWRRHVEELSRPGQAVSMTAEDWDYWLEVLPPRWMNGAQFCFAEGDEPFRLFWVRGGQFFGRQLTVEETLLFCRLAGIAPPAIQPPTRHIGAEERALIERHIHPAIGDCCGDGGA